MATITHPIRGWWRYSKLRFVPFGTNLIVALCLSVPAFVEHHVFEVAVVVFLGALVLAQLAWGAVNAERARRYGCW